MKNIDKKREDMFNDMSWVNEKYEQEDMFSTSVTVSSFIWRTDGRNAYTS